MRSDTKRFRTETMLQTFREIRQVDAADGIIFEPDSLRIDRIREDDRYGGVRLRTQAVLAGARIPVVIDIGFGDAIEPGLELLVYPTLLDFPASQLSASAREPVSDEKFQTMFEQGSLIVGVRAFINF